jgi:Domain of unknown function (DUF4760)
VFVSAVIAYLAMVNARRVARQRATLDLIEKVESGDHYRKIVTTFSELRRGKGFAHLSNPKTDDDKEVRQCLTDYMNHYELVAIGIRAGMLDEVFYRNWMRGPFVRDWNAAADWVQRERWKLQPNGTWEYYDKVFIEYELLARAWSDKAIQLSRLHSGPPSNEEAGGPGDEALPPPRAGDEGEGGAEKEGPPKRPHPTA